MLKHKNADFDIVSEWSQINSFSVQYVDIRAVLPNFEIEKEHWHDNKDIKPDIVCFWLDSYNSLVS